MNQMDENYWKNLATQWIRSQQQAQQQQIEIPQNHQFINKHQPSPPASLAPIADNHDVADMEIEDVKEEEQEKLWNFHHQLPPPHQLPQVPIILEQRKIFHNSLIVPEPPIINTFFSSEDDGASHKLVDMDMESDNENDALEDSNSASSGAMAEAQKKKMLPHWLRDGIEKMKREKEQEIARQEEEQRIKEEAEQRKKLMEEALKEIESENVVKSKYVRTVVKVDFKNLFIFQTFRIHHLIVKTVMVLSRGKIQERLKFRKFQLPQMQNRKKRRRKIVNRRMRKW
jgi:hypothetical protein